MGIGSGRAGDRGTHAVLCFDIGSLCLDWLVGLHMSVVAFSLADRSNSRAFERGTESFEYEDIETESFVGSDWIVRPGDCLSMCHIFRMRWRRRTTWSRLTECAHRSARMNNGRKLGLCTRGFVIAAAMPAFIRSIPSSSSRRCQDGPYTGRYVHFRPTYNPIAGRIADTGICRLPTFRKK
jgi:hypothetical protein